MPPLLGFVPIPLLPLPIPLLFPVEGRGVLLEPELGLARLSRSMQSSRDCPVRPSQALYVGDVAPDEGELLMPGDPMPLELPRAFGLDPIPEDPPVVLGLEPLPE